MEKVRELNTKIALLINGIKFVNSDKRYPGSEFRGTKEFEKPIIEYLFRPKKNIYKISRTDIIL